MAMSTRLRAKKTADIVEPAKLIIGKTISAPSSKLTSGLDAREKRRVFGDLENKIGAWSSQEDKLKPAGTYKDIKPRVDTRWKKAENPSQRTSKISASSTTSSLASAVAKPVPRVQLKPKVVKAPEIPTTTTAAQIKKTTKTLEVKKERSTSGSSGGELQLNKSPFKPKREKVEQINNFYESHSAKLLHQIEDIDEKDVDNPQLLAVYVNDIYSYLYKLERMFPIRDSFLANQMDVTPKMRSVLLDWINEVHNQFSLENETFFMAVSMIDRYLQSTTNTPRRFLQLVGVTALFMASKYEELMPPEINDFVYVTDDTYSKQQILQMEKKIFTGLNFNLSKPLPIHFLRRFAKAAGTLGDRQYTAAKYFMELAAIDYEMTKYKPSQIAAASLYLSLYIFNGIKSDNDLWTSTLEFYSNYTTEDLMPIMKQLATLVATAKDVKLKSVYSKYSHAVYKFTSTLPEMTGMKINELINRP